MSSLRSQRHPDTPASLIGLGELTHGTCEHRDLRRSKYFLQHVLGIRCVRHGEPAQMLAGVNDIIAVVAVGMPNAVDQEADNRWVLSTETTEHVYAIRERAMASQEALGIKHIGELVFSEPSGHPSVLLQDMDGNWWDITHRKAEFYQHIFAKGDQTEVTSS